MTAHARMPRGRGHAVCVGNRGNRASLEVRKVYRLVEDAAAAVRGLVRVIDEPGEDYLHPERYFVPIEVPRAAAREAFSKKPSG